MRTLSSLAASSSADPFPPGTIVLVSGGEEIEPLMVKVLGPVGAICQDCCSPMHIVVSRAGNRFSVCEASFRRIN
jgi:hypothetical protein